MRHWLAHVLLFCTALGAGCDLILPVDPAETDGDPETPVDSEPSEFTVQVEIDVAEDIENYAYTAQVTGCASGVTLTGLTEADTAFSLLLEDTGCVFELVTLTMDGVDFDLPAADWSEGDVYDAPADASVARIEVARNLPLTDPLRGDETVALSMSKYVRTIQILTLEGVESYAYTAELTRCDSGFGYELTESDYAIMIGLGDTNCAFKLVTLTVNGTTFTMPAADWKEGDVYVVKEGSESVSVRVVRNLTTGPYAPEDDEGVEIEIGIAD
ncbi:MAG: hypothetical protein GWP91_00110 [Rhodobacterales bacterium]|nr:hypothetical protein [Rhodobacterales bacterium]